jgi:putative transposase
VPHDTRDQVVDFVAEWSRRTELAQERFVVWLGVGRGKFFDWKQRYGKANEHNGSLPRDHWLLDEERAAIVAYHDQHPLEGYRRLAFMMTDDDVVAASPSAIYRVLAAARRLDRWNRKPSRKGTGFIQPTAAHEHWHVDIAYLNLAGTFYYLCSLLDGFSRAIVHWEIREAMRESDVETIVQRAREKYPDTSPRIISDNGPQFIAKDFKEFVRIAGMTHVRTSPYYPQSNGKIERYHRTLKADAIRPKAPASLHDAQKVVANFVAYYNECRLHSAIGYVTPADMLANRQATVWKARDQKLELARELRRQRRATQLPIPVSVTKQAPQSVSR